MDPEIKLMASLTRKKEQSSMDKIGASNKLSIYGPYACAWAFVSYFGWTLYFYFYGETTVCAVNVPWDPIINQGDFKIRFGLIFYC